MNVPSGYQKALNGFLIPPRSFTQMFSSAFRGMLSMLDEKKRTEFIGYLDKGIINDAVLSQATMGPVMMMSLFHDLKSPLFAKYKFDPSQFLEGVGPALQNFHNVSGALENQFQTIASASTKTDEATDTQAQEEIPVEGAENESILRLVTSEKNLFSPPSKMFKSQVVAVLNHDWSKEAKKDPESLAGQISNMMTSELLEMHQMSSKTAFLLQDRSENVIFDEGSCTVSNVALISARAYKEVKHTSQATATDESSGEESSEVQASDETRVQFEPVDYDIGLENIKDDEKVAAQVEVLYDVSQTFSFRGRNDDTDDAKAPIEENASPSESENQTKSEEEKPKSITTTTVGVATIEGLLNGAPDGELRWRLALYRPAFEFPGIPQSY